MDADVDERVGNMEGELALPRDNGELVFQAPWEGRAFGVAVALNNTGLYEWREFTAQLASKIAEDRTADAAAYYEQWLHSLEKLLIGKGLVLREELDARTYEYESGQRDLDED